MYVFLVFVLCTFTLSSGSELVTDPGEALVTAATDFVQSLQTVKLIDATPTGLHGETGRGGNRMGAMAIPLIIGFKLAGVIIVALASLKVLVLKSIAFSGLAVFVSLVLAAKYVLDKIKSKHDVTPYYYPMPMHAQAMAWAPQAMYEMGGTADLHMGDLQGNYAQVMPQQVAAPSTATKLNQTAYTLMPAQRKSSYKPPYKAMVYKTTVKEVAK